MKMKKLTSVLLVAACALSLVACGGSGDKKDSSKGGSSSKTAKVIDIDLTKMCIRDSFWYVWRACRSIQKYAMETLIQVMSS